MAASAAAAAAEDERKRRHKHSSKDVEGIATRKTRERTEGTKGSARRQAEEGLDDDARKDWPAPGPQALSPPAARRPPA